MKKTIQEIARSIDDGTATVCTAGELKDRIRRDDIPTVEEIDVVTCGTCGVMSGTYAVLTIPVADPGVFGRADAITINGVPAFPGPCPNEGLGIVDCIVYGTARASPRYGGGHLFRDIAEGCELQVEAESNGKRYERTISGHEIPFARLCTTRSAFCNYSAFVNQKDREQQTIFSVLPFPGNADGTTVSGCGEINPLANDPDMRFIHTGTPVLLNGASGLVLGCGTRSSQVRPNLALSAGFFEMEPEYMGGFITSAGPECLVSVGAAIPVTDEDALANLLVLDEDIPLPVVDLIDRSQVDLTRYSRVWQETSLTVLEDHEDCISCTPCLAEQSCPTGAIVSGHPIDATHCISCGTCTHVCLGGVYTMNMGSIPVLGRDTPVILRQSDRRRGERISADLKTRILCGTFQIQI